MRQLGCFFYSLKWVNLDCIGRKIPKDVQKPKYVEEVWTWGKGFTALDLPTSVKEAAARMASAGIATSTKNQYRSAFKVVQEVQDTTGVKMTMPWTTEMVINYVVHLRETHVPKLKATTISNYLAGIRMYHLLEGHFNVNLRPDIVKLMLTGAQNMDAVKARMSGKKARQPVTWTILKQIRQRLFEIQGSRTWKTSIWLVSSLAFSGSFRINELLAKEKMAFSSYHDLLAENVQVKSMKVKGVERKYLGVHLKHPKEERLSEGITIEVFEIEGQHSWACPVKAYEEYLKCGHQGTGKLPLIRTTEGSNYTGKDFNRDLKIILKGIVNYEAGPLTSHSFRAGLATWMAKAGCTDAEIQLTGRWKSDAFLRYIKTSRVSRAVQAAELVKKLAAVQ